MLASYCRGGGSALVHLHGDRHLIDSGSHIGFVKGPERREEGERQRRTARMDDQYHHQEARQITGVEVEGRLHCREEGREVTEIAMTIAMTTGAIGRGAIRGAGVRRGGDGEAEVTPVGVAAAHRHRDVEMLVQYEAEEE